MAADVEGKEAWARVGRCWAEKANVGFSWQSAPAKAEAMCYGLALGIYRLLP